MQLTYIVADTIIKKTTHFLGLGHPYYYWGSVMPQIEQRESNVPTSYDIDCLAGIYGR